MKDNKIQIKEGIMLHIIPTDKFKTNLLSIFLTTPLTRENVTKNSLLTAVLRRGSKTMPTQDKISKVLEEMYGTSFDCGIEKTGDNHVLKFYLEAVNDMFLPNQEEIFKGCVSILLEVILDPLTENGIFKQEYVESEKNTIRQLIDGKIDDKARYASERCIEEMYKNKPYGLYKYGYKEDLDQIDSKNLYEYYEQLLSSCKIDIFVSGDIAQEKVKDTIIGDQNIKRLIPRKPKYCVSTAEANKGEKSVKEIQEQMNITQGKLVMGLKVLEQQENTRYVAMIYNAILGGTATSKLFQNVREKASLAYSAGSTYQKQKNIVLIKCGIEIANYSKAVEIIKQQLQDMKNGIFEQEDIDNAKQQIISTIRTIPNEQDTEIIYYFGQEIEGTNISYEQYIKEIEQVTKEQIVEIAKQIQLDIIYFLTEEGKRG